MAVPKRRQQKQPGALPGPRPEVLETGLAELVGADVRRIVERAGVLLCSPDLAATKTAATNPYGDGQAADRIVEETLRRFVAAESSVRLRIAA